MLSLSKLTDFSEFQSQVDPTVTRYNSLGSGFTKNLVHYKNVARDLFYNIAKNLDRRTIPDIVSDTQS